MSSTPSTPPPRSTGHHGLRCLARRLAAALLLFATGCSSDLATVSGTVTLDGQPLDRGNVLFHCPGRAQGVGRIRPDGRYTAMTGTDDGIAPGAYKITVFALEFMATPEGSGEPTYVLITPQKYQTTKTSGLSLDVKPGRNDLDIQLKSD